MRWLHRFYRQVVPPREESPAAGVTMVAAAVVGVFAGLVSLAMDWAVSYLDLRRFPAGAAWGPWARIVVPAIVFLGVAWLIRRAAPEAQGPGLASVMGAIGRRGGYLRSRLVPIKAVATSLTIAAGAPLGLEGPVAQTGGAIGSLAGRRLRLGTANIRVLVAAGAAGALAAKYGAPIGGAVFAAEIILGGAAVAALLPLITAAFLAVLTRHIVRGQAFAEYEIVRLVALDLGDHLRLIALAALCGVAGAVFIKLLYVTDDAMRFTLRRWWIRAFGAGLTVGVVGLMCPEALGTGKHVVQGLLDGGAGITVGLLLFIVLARPVLSGVGLGGGVSGGIFAPSLVGGAALGMLVARFLGAADAPGHSAAYVLVGMAAMVAATMRAPLQAVLIIFELTRDYGAVPALMIGCAIAVKVSEAFEPESFFTRALVRSGERVRNGMDAGLLARLRVRDVMHREFVSLSHGADIRSVVEPVRTSENRTFPVTDDEGRLQGLVMLAALIAAAARGEQGDEPAEVRSIIEPDTVYLSPDDSLDRAWRVMGNYDYDCLPVCESADGAPRLVGICEKEAIVERLDREAFASLVAPNGDGAPGSP